MEQIQSVKQLNHSLQMKWNKQMLTLYCHKPYYANTIIHGLKIYSNAKWSQYIHTPRYKCFHMSQWNICVLCKLLELCMCLVPH